MRLTKFIVLLVISESDTFAISGLIVQFTVNLTVSPSVYMRYCP